MALAGGGTRAPRVAFDADLGVTSVSRWGSCWGLDLGRGLGYVIVAVWLQVYVESNTYPEAARAIYYLVFGMVIGNLLVIIQRHAFNIYLFGQLAKPGFASGQIRYSRASAYNVSSAMFFIQAGSALIYCLLLGEAFFFGSAIMVWSLAQQHRTLGKRAAVEEAAVAAGEAPPPPEKAGRQLVRICYY